MTASPLANNWRLGDRPDLGAMNVVNGLVRALDLSNPTALPCFDGAGHLLVGSDYGGQHSSSQFEALAFVVTDAGALHPWLNARSRLRAKYLPDRRRMSFKALGDRLRMEALPAFLSAADLLHGVLLVVLVDKRIASLFKSDDDIEAAAPQVRPLADWPARTAERVLRICHVVSLALAGLTHEGQHILWVTDQDEIAANVQRHTEFVKAFSMISSHYLEHTLGHLRIATTASDTGTRDLEDFVAIADLAAGAVCHVLNSYREAGTSPMLGVLVPPPRGVAPKAERLLHWFSDQRSSLKRLVISFEPIEKSSRLLIRHYAFNGSNAGPDFPPWLSHR
jgi:hypothetical protein